MSEHRRGLLRRVDGPLYSSVTDAAQVAGRIWAHRAGAEITAADRFERLHRELLVVGAHGQVCQMASEAAADEVRHHQLCADLARHLGAQQVPTSAPAAAPVVLGTTTPADRLLCELVAMSCITETLSAALLLQIKDRARETLVRTVAQEVVRDEIQHSRLGWAHLAAEASSRDVSFLADRVPQMLAATVEEEIFGAEEDDEDLANELSGLGGLCRRDRCQVFVATMNDVVFPGLRHHGIDDAHGARWLRERLR